jgi:D-glycero-D-manno-heptose 1,7-bisphosphate phosphatase
MGLVDGIGCWSEVSLVADVGRALPALFMDRDGVVVEEVGFLARAQDVRLLPSAAGVIAAFNQAQIPVVLITNQSGIARRYLTWEDFEAVQTEIARQLDETAGARVDAAFACAYHEDGEGALRVRSHPWRKPRPGMLFAASDQLGTILSRSWVVGDRASDLAAGRAAGLSGGLLVRSGHWNDAHDAASRALGGSGFEVRVAASVSGAVDLVDRMAAGASW